MSERPTPFATFGLCVDPLKQQVGGDHYKTMSIQPVEFILQNGLGFCEGNVVKYICRRKGNDRLQDLRKARHYLDILIGHIESAQVEEIELEPVAQPASAPSKRENQGGNQA